MLKDEDLTVRKNDRKGVTYDQFGPYKYPFACFYCRKVFKTAFGVQLRDIEDYLAKCPQCGGKMCYTGRAFKAPRREDTQQWEILEVLITSGFRFEPFGYDTGTSRKVCGK